MRQILQSLKTGEIEIADIPVPTVKAGHLLIQSARSLISVGTERMLLDFGRAGWIDKARQQPDKVRQVFQKIRTDGLLATAESVMRKLDQPLALGYSNAGRVVAVGKGVTGFAAGDRVVSNGNHADVVCVPENLCAKIPDGVGDDTASFTVIASIALEGIRLVQPTLGESVAVMGLGLIGLLTVQMLRANGCRVIGFDFDPSKVALAREFGAEAHDLKDGIDPVAAATAFSRGHGVDAVIITAATKSDDPIHQAPQMCRKRGRVVLVGVVGLNLSRDDFYKKEITFQVSCSYGPGRYEAEYEKKGLDYPIGFVRWTEQRNFEAVLDMMAAGSIRTEKLVTRVIAMDEAKKAYEAVAAGENVLGLVLDYGQQINLERRSVILQPAAGIAAAPGKGITGFIGAGNFASGVLVPAFAAAGAGLKTIASSGGVSGTHLGRKSGFRISTTDYRTIIDDPEIDTIAITTQHGTHAKFVCEALSAGKHVFVEKPLCLTWNELAEIEKAYQDACAAKPRILMVGFNRRFSPLVQTVKRLLDSQQEQKSIVMTVNAGAIPGDHWTQDEEAGGGRILGEACHFIDLIRFLVGAPILDVHTAVMRRKDTATPPDTVTVTITFSDGSLGVVNYFANGHKDYPKERLEAFSGGRILVLDNFRSLSGHGWPGFKGESLWAQDKGHAAGAKAFLEAVRTGGAAPIPFAEIVEVTKATLKAAGIAPDRDA
ncbi:MAG TPA: bi-domain-containing oxidoreductase [Candidatus Ozemobacteraceae bacterium]|nr:bi-domain-containing oxidoreductase [Candidatus Ozemobacteraceae bacterium]